MRFPESPRFHFVPRERLKPRFGSIHARDVYVYLPQAALQDARRRFPVLYCQDGQNIWDDPEACFGHGGWCLNRTVDDLTATGQIEPVILVGIPNTTDRKQEYTAGRSYADLRDHAYANYLCDVIKPYVERHFPARKDRRVTGLLGSSLGGLISLLIAHHYPQMFGRVACLSGAFECKDREGKTFLDFLWECGRQDLRIYLDAGTIRDGAPWTRKVRDIYLALGWETGRDLFHYEDVGAEHNERFWRARVWRALTFLYGRPTSATG